MLLDTCVAKRRTKTWWRNEVAGPDPGDTTETNEPAAGWDDQHRAGPEILEEAKMTDPSAPNQTLFDLLKTTEPDAIGLSALNELTPEEAQEVQEVVQEVEQYPAALLNPSILSGLIIQ